jgi:hypothetical protein
MVANVLKSVFDFPQADILPIKQSSIRFIIIFFANTNKHIKIDIHLNKVDNRSLEEAIIKLVEQIRRQYKIQ